MQTNVQKIVSHTCTLWIPIFVEWKALRVSREAKEREPGIKVGVSHVKWRDLPKFIFIEAS
jgi:hypothetical protein